MVQNKNIKNNNKNIKNLNKKIKDLRDLQQHILDELYAFDHLKGKLFVVNNIYKVKDKYYLDISIKNKKNQNEKLIEYVQQQFTPFPHIIEFLDENFRSKNPLKIQLFFNNQMVPVLLVNNKGYYLPDFNSNMIYTPDSK